MHSPVKNDAQPRHTHVTHTYTEREGQRERQTRLLLVQPCLRRQARCVRACAGKPDGLAQREGVGVRDLNRGERDGERRSRGRGRGREGGSTLLLARSFARAILGGIARGLAYSGGGSHSKGRGTHTRAHTHAHTARAHVRGCVDGAKMPSRRMFRSLATSVSFWPYMISAVPVGFTRHDRERCTRQQPRDAHRAVFDPRVHEALYARTQARFAELSCVGGEWALSFALCSRVGMLRCTG